MISKNLLFHPVRRFLASTSGTARRRIEGVTSVYDDDVSKVIHVLNIAAQSKAAVTRNHSSVARLLHTLTLLYVALCCVFHRTVENSCHVCDVPREEPIK